MIKPKTRQTRDVLKTLKQRINSTRSSRSKQASNRRSKPKILRHAAKKLSTKFEIPEFVEKQELKQCNFCLRKFNAESIKKHSVVCQKKTLKKTQVFDTKSKRLHHFKANENDKSILKESKFTSNSKVKAKRWKSQSKQLRQAVKCTGSDEVAEVDYVQCHHCGRTFNEKAAERHIPKCKDLINKPKRLLKGSGGFASTKAKLMKQKLGIKVF